MHIIKDYIQMNEFTRPGRALGNVLGIVMHWTAMPLATAKQNRDFFNTRRDAYGSAHYIIDQTGEIIAAIPENEVAYHCGTNQKDPVSGKVYTDYARQKFTWYASEYSSPNNCTIGIEMCPIDADGNFTTATITAAVELCADICRRHKLQADDICTHFDVVGWKACPLLWVKRPYLFEAFKTSVKDQLARNC